jgi:3D (Asp-Asp-Asp) domain-containing protein
MARKYDQATNLSLSMPHFDIWMASKSDAKQFGRQVATVTVSYEVD